MKGKVRYSVCPFTCGVSGEMIWNTHSEAVIDTAFSRITKIKLKKFQLKYFLIFTFKEVLSGIRLFIKQNLISFHINESTILPWKVFIEIDK